jgi:hypothetical protein
LASPTRRAPAGEISGPALPVYDDRSLRPSGVQARINSFSPSLWDRVVQRTAYLTGWELSPFSIAAALVGVSGMLFLLVRIFRLWKKNRGKSQSL